MSERWEISFHELVHQQLRRRSPEFHELKPKLTEVIQYVCAHVVHHRHEVYLISYLLTNIWAEFIDPLT